MMYVLVVDDEAEVSEIIQAHLELKGYKVLTAQSVEQAMGVLRCFRFAAVVTDYCFPGRLTGLDLVKHILENYPGVAVSIMSGNLESDKVPVEVGFLPKPFNIHALLALLPKSALPSN